MTEAGWAKAWHGLHWSFERQADGARSPTLAALCSPTIALDPRGVDEAWGLCPPTHRPTIVSGIERRDPSRSVPTRGHGEALARTEAFEAAVATIANSSVAPVVALGGGLDATAVLLAWRAHTGAWPDVATLRTGDDNYDEVDQARSICTTLGAKLSVIDVTPAELVALLPRAVAVCQCPLYGLHPVGRLGFAQALRARGFETIISGDGADAVFGAHPDYDYVPVVAALTEGTMMSLRSPFFDDAVVASWLHAPDPNKRWIRDYVTERGAPPWLGRMPKRSRSLAAPMSDLGVSPALLDELGTALRRRYRGDTDRERISWISLALLWQRLRGAS